MSNQYSLVMTNAIPQEAVGIFEAVMYVWIVAFAYDELSGIIDAGVIF
jgi:hypothetical protein